MDEWTVDNRIWGLAILKEEALPSVKGNASSLFE